MIQSPDVTENNRKTIGHIILEIQPILYTLFWYDLCFLNITMYKKLILPIFNFFLHIITKKEYFLDWYAMLLNGCVQGISFFCVWKLSKLQLIPNFKQKVTKIFWSFSRDPVPLRPLSIQERCLFNFFLLLMRNIKSPVTVKKKNAVLLMKFHREVAKKNFS